MRFLLSVVWDTIFSLITYYTSLDGGFLPFLRKKLLVSHPKLRYNTEDVSL